MQKPVNAKLYFANFISYTAITAITELSTDVRVIFIKESRKYYTGSTCQKY